MMYLLKKEIMGENITLVVGLLKKQCAKENDLAVVFHQIGSEILDRYSFSQALGIWQRGRS